MISSFLVGISHVLSGAVQVYVSLYGLYKFLCICVALYHDKCCLKTA